MDVKIASMFVDRNLDNLRDINVHYSTSFVLNGNCSSNFSLCTSNGKDTIINMNISPSEHTMQQFISFVGKLIKSDLSHQDYIYSCVRRNHNRDILFFNIGGKYRFCPRKGTHHQ